jgi:hypothetical protein
MQSISDERSGTRYVAHGIANDRLFTLLSPHLFATLKSRFYCNVGNVGVPIKLLFEAEGMKVTAEVCGTIVFCVLVVLPKILQNSIDP